MFTAHDSLIYELGNTLADQLSKLTEEEQSMILIWMFDRLSEIHGIDSMRLCDRVHTVFTTLYPHFADDNDDELDIFFFDENED